MGRSQRCQRCGATMTANTTKVGIRRKICWKFCKIVMKHVVAELMDDDWVSNHKDIALYYRGGRQQGQLKAEMETSGSPYLCQICNDRIEAETEAAAAAAAEREAKATAVVAAMKRKVQANTAAATARGEAEAARAYCLILMIGCFICVSVSVGVCGWCFMRS